MPFSEPELEYLASQRLGRLATLAPDGAPQNRPVGFRYNPEADAIDIFGWKMGASRKFRNIQTDPRVAFVVDDVASVDPWRVRGVEIRGDAQALTEQDTYEHPGSNEVIRIHPQRTFAWGLERNTQLAPSADTKEENQ